MSNDTAQQAADAKMADETLVMVKFPSVACTAVGRWLGRAYESISVPKVNGIKPSHLLFVLPSSPVAAVVYFWLKALGEKYLLTNRSVQTCKAFTDQVVSQVALSDIETIDVCQDSGQRFYNAADLHLKDAAGKTLLVLSGIPRADVFRQTILEARDAWTQVRAALEHIQARQNSPVAD